MADDRSTEPTTAHAGVDEAADLAARRRAALRSRATIAGDYSPASQAALGVCNDGTPGDDGLTPEGERYADSIIAAFTDDPVSSLPAATMDEVKAEMRDARRAIAMRYYVATDGEPFTEEECAGYGVTPAGRIAEDGLTGLGKQFADHVATLLDERFGTPGMSAALGQGGAQASSAASALVDALDIRTPFRHALRDMARSLAEHLDGDHTSGPVAGMGGPLTAAEAQRKFAEARAAGREPTVGFNLLGGADVPDEVREALSKAIADMFGGAEVVDLSRPPGDGEHVSGVGGHEPGDVAMGTTEFPASGPVPDDASSGAPGASVFATPDDFTTPSAPDSGTPGGSDHPAASSTE